MKTLSILTMTTLLAFGGAVAHAQDTKTSVPEYEQKNTANLNSQVGFVGLNVGEEITSDNTERAVTGLNNVQHPAPEPAPVIVKQAPTAVIFEKSVVGNTDTGVDLDQIKPELDNAY